MSVEEAKKVLKENGFQVDNLWHIDDVKSKFNCDDDEAMGVLESALVNDATMEQIWFAIDFHGEDDGLEKPKLSDCCDAPIEFAMLDGNGTDLEEGTQCSECGEENPNEIED